MIKRLLIILVVQVGLTKVRVGFHQDKQVSLVNVHEHLAQSELLYPHLDRPLRVLGLGELIECPVFLLYTMSSTS